MGDWKSAATNLNIFKANLIPYKYYKQFNIILLRIHCDGFGEGVSRQRLVQHVPTCNSGSCVSVDERYGSLLGNSQHANELDG
jgi:hypothetical protein